MYRDIKAFKSLGVCGHVRPQQLLSIVAKNRIASYEKDGLIEKVVYEHPNQKKPIEGYRLTSRGYRFIKEHIGVDYPYHNTSLKHDLKVADKYFSLTEKERETVVTEKEARVIVKNKIEDLRKNNSQDYDFQNELFKNSSSVDFIYSTTDKETGEVIEVGFEAITRNYTDSELLQKSNFATLYNCRLEWA